MNYIYKADLFNVYKFYEFGDKNIALKPSPQYMPQTYPHLQKFPPVVLLLLLLLLLFFVIRTLNIRDTFLANF